MRTRIAVSLLFLSLAGSPVSFGGHDFCLQSRGPYFTGPVLQDEAGHTVFTMRGEINGKE
jgi:hypothetical protein